MTMREVNGDYEQFCMKSHLGLASSVELLTLAGDDCLRLLCLAFLQVKTFPHPVPGPVCELRYAGAHKEAD